MSQQSVRVPIAEPTKITRTDVRQAEQTFGPVMADVARMLWPRNTAANVAAAAHCTTRAAEYYLAGTHEWSGDAIAAIVSEILKRHAMRHVKVVAR